MRSLQFRWSIAGLIFFSLNFSSHAQKPCRFLVATIGDGTSSAQDEPPVWDLNGLYGYSGPQDLRIGADLEEASALAHQFQQNYTGEINTRRLSARRLLAAIKNYEIIMAKMHKIEMYAYALITINSNDTHAQTLYAQVNQASGEISSTLSFFAWELSQIPPAHMQRLLATGKLNLYRHFIETTLKEGPYQLPTRALEGQLALLGPHLNATERIRNNVDSNLVFPFQPPGEPAPRSMTAENLRPFRESPDPAIRLAANEALTAGYHALRKLFADLYSEFVQTQLTLRRTLRHYPHVASPRHLSNELSPQDVDRLVRSVVNHYPTVQRHWALKRQALGLSSFRSSDTEAPFLRPDEKPPLLTWREMSQNALTAAAPYVPPEILKFLEETCLRRCVHARSTPGKEAGGYMGVSIPNIPPIVMMHFHGTQWDQHVLVHEMIIGHAFDYILRGQNQSLLNYGGSGMFRSETASTFAEVLFLDHVLKKGPQDPRTKLRTLMADIDNINLMIFREIVYYLFELDVYAHVEKHKRIDADTLEAIWMKHYRDYFGNEVEPVKHFEALWALPVHFYEPFYVYAYTAGQLAGIRMFLNLSRDPQYFARIMEAYRRGSSAAVKDIYRENLGIDLDSPRVWVPAFQYLEKLIDDEEALIQQLSG